MEMRILLAPKSCQQNRINNKKWLHEFWWGMPPLC